MGKNRKIRVAISLGFFVFLAIPSVYADTPGDQHVFSIDASYDIKGRSQINATLRFSSAHTNMYVADDYWTALDFAGQSQLTNLMQALAREFDERIYPTETAFFGSEPNPGIDGDPRITFVLSALRHNVGGYFDSTHEYPKSDVPSSNEREMIYINTFQFADTQRIYPFVAHEFQHLISFNQKEKLRNVADEVWLNELRSEYAITLMGYNDPYAGSNLERRVASFNEQPSDSVTEWKNNFWDYGQIGLLGEYITDHWSSRVIAETLTTSETGIASINAAMARNGFTETFSDLFGLWSAANSVNNVALSPKLGYTRAGLRNLHAAPTQILSVSNDAVVQINAMMKDYEQHWYDVQGLPPGSKGVLRVKFASSVLPYLRVPYVLYKTDGTIEYHFAALSAAASEIQIPGIGITVSRVVVMPFKAEKIAGFSGDEPSSSVALTVDRIETVTNGLKEGDFIRAEGDYNIYIINNFGYKRLVLSPKICLQYGHLGARGCFDAVHVVTTIVRDSYTTSPYYANGETFDGKIYQLIETGEDSAYLKPITHPLDNSVFFINNLEQYSYGK